MKHTKIFLDSGNPEETKELLALGVQLAGQTTNPTLVSKNPEVQKRLEGGQKLSEAELLELYKDLVQAVNNVLPDGSISIEVAANKDTMADAMIAQGLDMNEWIPNAHIKLPITDQGLIAAHDLNKLGVNINMTLCFTQEQAAAVDCAARQGDKGDIFVSPFVGRVEGIGLSGVNLVENIMKMYDYNNSKVEVLSASVRNMDHFYKLLSVGTDIITAPFDVIKQWAQEGAKYPKAYKYAPAVKPLSYKAIKRKSDFRAFDIRHELTDDGLKRFDEDWNWLIS